jgi:hypothetical protein
MTWAKPRREPTQSTYTPKPRAPAVAVAGPARATVAVPKLRPVRDEAYRRAVAALPCAHCGIEGHSQAAHGDEGKGMAIKASDDTCYPACGPRPGEPGCHWLIGTSGKYTQKDRRTLERLYAAETRLKLGVA